MAKLPDSLIRKPITFALSEKELSKLEDLTYASMHGRNRSAWLQEIIDENHAKLEKPRKTLKKAGK